MDRLYDSLTDIQLLDRYCEGSLNFIDPRLFREIERRGLAKYIDGLSQNAQEAKSAFRVKLSQDGIYIGDKAIEQIASVKRRIEETKSELASTDAHEFDKILTLTNRLCGLVFELMDFFKYDNDI
jgi:hypothetical protein